MGLKTIYIIIAIILVFSPLIYLIYDINISPIFATRECKDIVPDRLNANIDYNAAMGAMPVYQWKDGKEFSGSFSKGYFQGENINLYYSSNLYYYNETIENGIIKKPRVYNIKLVLDPNDKTEGGYKIVSFSCKY